MNEFIVGLGVISAPHARQMAEYLDTHPDPGADPLRGSLQRAYEPERQYQDLAVYAMPGYVPGWQA